MRVTAKGQVTIPLEIRCRLGIQPHCDVEFAVRHSQVFLQKAQATSGRGKQLIDIMRGRGQRTLTTDQIMAMTRGE